MSSPHAAGGTQLQVQRRNLDTYARSQAAGWVPNLIVASTNTNDNAGDAHSARELGATTEARRIA